MVEYTLSKQLMDRIKSTLEPEEQIEWLGKPTPSYFAHGGIGALVFGIPWTAFIIFCYIKILSHVGLHPALLYMLLPLIFGLLILSIPIWNRRNWTKNVYFITNKRAIRIYQGRSNRIIQSFYPKHLQDIYTKEHKNGLGDVIITCQTLRNSWFAKQYEPLGFLLLKEPKEIEDKLKQLAVKVAESSPALSTRAQPWRIKRAL